MKNIFTLFFFLILTNISAQENFEYGYYIDQSGNKKEGEISQIRIEQMPAEFYFRNKKKTEKIDLKDVIEIKYGTAVFKKKNFRIDASIGIKVNDLSNKRDMKYVDKTDFLQLLVDGDYSLYRYIDKGISVFFYETNNQGVQTLVYKKYREADYSIKENKDFLLQLEKDIRKNEYFKEGSYTVIKYATEDLINYFTLVNGNSNREIKKAKVLFNFFVGYSNHSFDIDFAKDLDSERYGHITIMPEIEYVLNNHVRNPFSFYFNLKYHAFKKEYTVQHESGIWNHKVNYQSIFTSLGIKKYFLSNENISFYGKLGVSFNNPLKGEVESPLRAWSVNMVVIDTDGAGYNIGLGMKIYKKINIELDYDYSFNTTYTKNNSALNFKLGYTF